MWSSSALLTAAAAAFAATGFAAAAELDLAALEIVPLRGQAADQARRDRYECHNWAVQQSGFTPVMPADEDRAAERGERIARVVNGALIGGTLGGLVRATQRKESAHGVLAGAAGGAAVGAATRRGSKRDELDEDSHNYLRALSACMEGRGYRVEPPGGTGA